MEKQFQTDADTFFSERHSSILVKFRNENDRNTAFLQNLAVEKENIKAIVTDEVWQKINNLIELMTLHSNIESKYLYGQGLKDCTSLSHFLDTDFANADFEEIIFNPNETEGIVYYGDKRREDGSGSITIH